MSNNISWSANANYEQLSDSHVKKESKTTKTKSKKDDKVDKFIEVDINRSYELLGEIIGETVADDIINEVFARFCLGK